MAVQLGKWLGVVDKRSPPQEVPIAWPRYTIEVLREIEVEAVAGFALTSLACWAAMNGLTPDPQMNRAAMVMNREPVTVVHISKPRPVTPRKRLTVVLAPAWAITLVARAVPRMLATP